MEAFATVDDVIKKWRALTPEEMARAAELISDVSYTLRVEAEKVGKDLDAMAKESEAYAATLKSVVVDIVARTLMTSTNQEPMTQSSESALGYSWSGTYLVPGGGLFIKKSELAKLGLRRQKYGVIDFYGTNSRNDSNSY